MILAKILTFLSLLLFGRSSPPRIRRQVSDELLKLLGDDPRDQLAKMVLTREGDRFEGGQKQAEYLMRIENYLKDQGQGLEDPDNEWLEIARKRARQGRLR